MPSSSAVRLAAASALVAGLAATALARQVSPVADHGQRLAVLNRQERALAERFGSNRTELARFLGALMALRRDPPPALLVSPRSAVDAVNAAILIRAVMPDLQRRAAVLGQEAHRLAAVRRATAIESGALFSAESDAADRSDAMGRLLRDERSLVQRLTLGTAPVAIDQPPDRLTPPVTGPIVRRFGQPWPGQARSEGLAWRAGPGDPVRSPALGRVEFAGPLRGWGVVVILRTAGGYHLVLAGLGDVAVTPDQALAEGQVIGRMPGPEASDAKFKGKAPAELYLEARRGDTPVDPAKWLAQGGTKAGARRTRALP